MPANQAIIRVTSIGFASRLLSAGHGDTAAFGGVSPLVAADLGLLQTKLIGEQCFSRHISHAAEHACPR